MPESCTCKKEKKLHAGNLIHSNRSRIYRESSLQNIFSVCRLFFFQSLSFFHSFHLLSFFRFIFFLVFKFLISTHFFFFFFLVCTSQQSVRKTEPLSIFGCRVNGDLVVARVHTEDKHQTKYTNPPKCARCRANASASTRPEQIFISVEQRMLTVNASDQTSSVYAFIHLTNYQRNVLSLFNSVS